jgi:hypothetical protein
LNALEYGKEVQRRNVAELLGYIGDRSSVRGLIYALSDSSPAVRAEAARALGRIGDPTAVSHLRKLWRRENNPTVRRQASLAITHLLTGGVVAPTRDDVSPVVRMMTVPVVPPSMGSMLAPVCACAGQPSSPAKAVER